MTRLVDLCQTFHLPMVTLTDQPGLAIGREAERRGTIRYGVRAIAAVYQATVPTVEVIIRRVFGVGGAGMSNRHRFTQRSAWPGDLCRSKGELRQPIAKSWRPVTIRQHSSRRSARAWKRFARRFAPLSASGLRRSSIRGTPVPSSANGCMTPTRCYRPRWVGQLMALVHDAEERHKA